MCIHSHSQLYEKFHHIRILTLVVLFTNLIITSASTAYASSDAYFLGYIHNHADASILGASDTYMNQNRRPFQLEAFILGYDVGHNASTDSTENESPLGGGTFKMNATIYFDRRDILEAEGNNLGNAWFTINGIRYDNGTYYDMSDWVYDDFVEIRGINTNPLSEVIELPSLDPGQDLEVCLNDDEGYNLCKTVVNSDEKRPVKVSFTYP